MDLISIIVPVYKVEKYLDKCIESIVNQTYENLEIILVDDGSPDNCGAMCDAWAEKDSRIKVIHQTNQGGGAARNTGLDMAAGEYIGFVDSDDYIAPEMYGHLHSLLAPDVDIAECAYVITSEDEAVFAPAEQAPRTYSAEEAMGEHLCDRVFRQVIWNKLYRRCTVENVRFPAGTGIDDEFWTYQALGNARKLIHSSRNLYAYRQQSQSVMHKLNMPQRLRAVEAKRRRHDYIVEKFPELADMSLKSLWFTSLYQGQLALCQCERNEKKEAIAYLCGILREYPALRVQGSVKEKVWLLLASLSFRNTCRLRNWLKIGL